MRQIYLLASDADAQAAGEISDLLAQRGYQVRRADEALAFPPARPQEITLALWSRNVELSAKQILFTNRAIDAWTEGRLIFARLDHAMLPRGLGDVDVIDLSFAPARIAAVWKIVEAAQDIDKMQIERRGDVSLSGGIPEPEEDLSSALPPQAKLKARRAFSAGPAVAVGLVAVAACLSLGFLTMPAASKALLAGAALTWGAVAGAVAGYASSGRRTKARAPALRRKEAAAPPAAAPMEEAPDGEDPAALADDAMAPVFVSYARRDGDVVYPLVAEVEAAGRSVWIDRNDLDAGGNWAGLIVRAIRESDTFCLMCSAEAFQSDHVRREIYIADKYKRKLLPVRLDFAEMPEDFEYFLIDRQWLDLTAVDPVERAARLTAALAR